MIPSKKCFIFRNAGEPLSLSLSLSLISLLLVYFRALFMLHWLKKCGVTMSCAPAHIARGFSHGNS
jgi:hypothetical protein